MTLKVINDSRKKIILYGIGHNYELFKCSNSLNEYEIVALADRLKQGQLKDGKVIISPEDIKKLEYDEIFVLPTNAISIIDYLQFGIEIERSLIRDSAYLNEILLNDLVGCKYVMLGDDTDYLNYPYETLNKRSDFRMCMPLDMVGRMKFDLKCMPADNHEVIFIVRDHLYQRFSKAGIIDYLKARYCCSRWVTVMSDMCDGEYGRLITRGNNYISRLKNDFEFIITYHSQDAIKYGLTYLEQTYPLIPNDIGTPKMEYDVLFVGEAKNRLDILHEIYRTFNDNGISCRFCIDHVKKCNFLKDVDILYNQPISYADYLREITKCRCLLEVCQKGNESSYRYDEALIYGKKLLFNDRTILSRKYYNPKYMKFINTPYCVDREWIKHEEKVDYGYKNDYSPEHFLKFIDEILQIG